MDRLRVGEAIEHLLEQAPAVLFAFDRRGVITLSEGRGLDPLRLRQGQAIGRSVFELYADKAAIVDAARTVLGGVPVSTTADVDGYLYATEYVPQRDPGGDVIGAVGLAIEVSARRSAADLLASLDLLVWQAEAASLRFLFVNDRAVSLLGYAVSDWLEQPDFWHRHLHPDEREHTLALMRAVASDGVERSCVHRFARADGSYRWFRTTVRASRRESAPPELTGMMLDVTERVRSQATLTQREERFRLIFEQLPTIVYTVDRNLRFTTGAGAGVSQLGLQPDQTVMGISLYEYFQTDDANHPLIAAHLRAIGGESVDREATWVGRTYALHIDPFRDAEGEIIGAIGLALDITDRKRVEEERDLLLCREQQARANAEEAVRARDEFLGIAAHELFTPITSLKLSLQLIRSIGPTNSERFFKLLATGEAQARRLASLVGDLLDVTRIRAGTTRIAPEMIDLKTVTEEVIARFDSDLSRAQCPLRLTAPRPVVGLWDRSRIDLVVTNLLSNAIKYGAGKPIEVTVDADTEKAMVLVRDHGIGIAPDRISHIFDRFERAVPTRNYGGLGLGLFIVRSIVEAHQGSVRVQSEPGRGALFTVELPLTGRAR